MHKFLRAVGFSNLKKKDLEIITEEIIDKPDVIKVTRDSEGNEFAELPPARMFSGTSGFDHLRFTSADHTHRC